MEIERSRQALRHMCQGCTLTLPVAAVAEAAADPIAAVDGTAVVLEAAALQSLLCCQASRILAVRSSACCLCGCVVELEGRHC